MWRAVKFSRIWVFPWANRRGDPRGLIPMEGSSKKDWLSMDGWEAWQSVPKEASLGRRRICRGVCENTGYSLIHSLSTLLCFRPLGNQTGWNDHTKSPKCLLLCSLAGASKSSSFNIEWEREMVNVCCLATNLTTILADKCHSLHAKRGVYIKVSGAKWCPGG